MDPQQQLFLEGRYRGVQRNTMKILTVLLEMKKKDHPYHQQRRCLQNLLPAYPFPPMVQLSSSNAACGSIVLKMVEKFCLVFHQQIQIRHPQGSAEYIEGFLRTYPENQPSERYNEQNASIVVLQVKLPSISFLSHPLVGKYRVSLAYRIPKSII